MYDTIQERIAEYEKETLRKLAEMEREDCRGQEPPKLKNRQKAYAIKKHGEEPMREALYRISGVDLMAIDAIELAMQIQPDVVILVTGDADFAHLALQLRRRGIHVEVAAVAQNLGSGLKTSANEIIDLAPLLATFDPLV